jgi:hypothetical protein
MTRRLTLSPFVQILVEEALRLRGFCFVYFFPLQ